MIEIVDLKNHPHHLPTLARWFVDQWHYRPYEAEVAELQECLHSDGIPITLLALDANELVGTVAIILRDMETRPDLSPWLASLYVVPERRREGLGRRLISEVIRLQESEKIDPLYLFTSDQQELYRTFGWKDKEVVDYHGYTVTIMERRLTPP